MEKVTVENIKERFPRPVRMSHAERYVDECLYCVGGAFISYIDSEADRRKFPASWLLASELKNYNNLLPVDKASHFSKMIINANDSGRFARAWGYLDKALNFKEKN